MEKLNLKTQSGSLYGKSDAKGLKHPFVKLFSFKKLTALLTAFVFTWSMCITPVMAETVKVEGGSIDVNVQDNTTNWNVTGNPVWNVPEFNVPTGSIYNISGLNQNASLALLVGGGQASNIFGTMNLSNLDFILQNIAGINIGSSAMINLNNASLIASTLPLNTSVTDFLARQYEFSGQGGFLMNDGKIVGNNADLVALISNAIENKGTIEVPMGTVALAAGDTVTVGISGDGLVSIGVDEATANKLGLKDQIKNTGTITADGGKVVLNAQAMDGLFDKAISIERSGNSINVVKADNGTIEFQSLDDIYSEAIIKASGGTAKITSTQGSVTNAGTIEANKGKVEVKAAKDVTNTNKATLQANDGSVIVVSTKRNVINQGTVKADKGKVEVTAAKDMTNKATIQADEGSIKVVSTKSDVVNEGTMTADKGEIKVISEQGKITNVGTVKADHGTVQLTAEQAAYNKTILEALYGKIEVTSNKAEVTNEGTIDATGGEVKLQAAGAVETKGVLKAEQVTERGASFKMGGRIEIGTMDMDNLDHRADIAAAAELSGNFTDEDDISVLGNFSLIGDTTIQTDSNVTGDDGTLTWAAAYLLTGNGYDLTLKVSKNSTVGAISGVNLLTFDKNIGKTPTYTGSTSNDISVNTITTTYGTTFSKNVTVGSDHMIYSASDAPGGLQYMDQNLGYSYKMANNIDASETSSWNAGAGFDPVGDQDSGSEPSWHGFTGVFDGQGHTIRGLYINRPNDDYVGLFGYTFHGTAQNVGMIEVNITGRDSVGAIIGSSDDRFQYGERINKSYSTGTLSGRNSVGGLIGGSYDTSIVDSWSSANVTGNTYVGGIAGGIGFSRIRRCYSTGIITGNDYVGGISGYQSGVTFGVYNYLTDSFSTATINSAGTYVGGLAGYLQSQYDASRSYYTDSNHQNGFGTYVADPTAFMSSSHAVYTNWDFDADGVSAGHNGTWIMAGLPHLQMEWTPTITNAAQLQMMALDLDASYTLANDIDASATSSWNAGAGFDPVGDTSIKFSGMFDGASNTISGLTINRPTENNIGLFGYASAATIQNVGLVGVSVSGSSNVGGLVGLSYPTTITSSYVTGSVSDIYEGVGGLVGQSRDSSITSSYAMVSVSGGDDPVFSPYAGGLVGYNLNSPITSSYATGSVSCSSHYAGGLVGWNGSSSITSSYATGSVSGNNEVGGLVGYNESSTSITSSYATGNVTGSGQYAGGLVGRTYMSPIISSYATGSVNGGTYVGGLVGRNHQSSITSSFSTGVATSTGDTAGGLIGSNYSSTLTNDWWYNGTNTLDAGTGNLPAGQVDKAASAASFYSSSHAVYTGASPWDFDADGVSAGHNGTWIMAGLPHLQMEWTDTITNAAQLQMMALDLDANYTLANDIDASDTVNWNAGAGFDPVGGSPSLEDAQPLSPYTGTFDGQGYTITGLTINRHTGSAASTDLNSTWVGLFGAAAGIVKNVGMLNMNIWGNLFVGGLVGELTPTGSVLNSYTTGTMRSTYDQVGGLVGQSHGLISNTYSTASIQGDYWWAGGLVGATDTTSVISNSYATGNVSLAGGGAGGLVGTDSGTISHSFATGTVSGGSAGGLVSGYGSPTIDHSYFTGGPDNGRGTYESGGVAALMNSAHAVYSGWDFDADGVSAGHNGTWIMAGLPHLQMEWSETITNVAQLQMMALDLDASYTLANNIDASATSTWNSGAGFAPIASDATRFSGTLDGAEYTIDDLYINQNGSIDGQGMFKYIGATGIVENLNLTDANVYGRDCIGTLAAWNYGLIQNSSVTGTIPGTSGGGTHGGMVAGNYGTIDKSYANVSVTGNHIGGLVGHNAGTISNSYATGTVSGMGQAGGLVHANTGNILNSYATGNVTGTTNVGGLAGQVTGGTIINSYGTGTVSGGSSMGGLVGTLSGATLTNNWWYNSQTKGVGDNANNEVAGQWQKDPTGAFSFYNPGHAVYDPYNAGGHAWGFSEGGAGSATWVPVVDNDLKTASYPVLGWQSTAVHMSGAGTSGSPYLITNVGQLQDMIYGLSSYYQLSNNINADIAGYNTGSGFVPVGNNSTKFTGNFDGNSKTISNLSINHPELSYVGLFGYAALGTHSIQNLNLMVNNITGSSSSNTYTGGLVGRLDSGTITSSSVTVNTGQTVSGSYVGGMVGYQFGGTITNSYAMINGTVSSTAATNAGGLVGVAFGDFITNSYATILGTVSAGSGNAGGLVGNNNAAISNSYATVSGTVSGGSAAGLVGLNYRTITDSYAVVTGTAPHSILGGNYGSATNCYGVGGSFVGGSLGSSYSYTNDWYSGTQVSQPSGVNFESNGSAAFYNPGHAVYSGWDFDADGVSAGHNGNWIMAGLPHLQMEWSETITNVAQLQMMALDLDASYTLANNIDASDTINWNGGAGFDPVGNYVFLHPEYAFRGTFNGQNFLINDLSINRPGENYVGLLGYTIGAVIQDVGLMDVDVNGGNFVGSLSGWNKSSSVTHSHATGSVSGNEGVGGLVGYTESSSSIANSYATSTVNGTRYIGGLVGWNECSAITSSYATGSVSGVRFVGGLIGDNYESPITSSYATGNVSGTTDFGGLVGYNTASGITGITDSYSHKIYNVLDLQLMQYDLDGNFTLMNNIDASDTVNWNAGLGFDPIGNSTVGWDVAPTTPFTGDFVGGGHTITGLTINRGAENYVGLFGATNGSTITNVGLVNESVSGAVNVGGLVGDSWSSDITSSYVTGSISGNNTVGGLVGVNSLASSISNSYSASSVSGERIIGGIAGYNYGATISDTYATGDISANGWTVGGLVAINYEATISNSYATGNITGNTDVGGLVGWNWSEGTISNSYFTGSASGVSSRVGGVVGYNDEFAQILNTGWYTGATTNAIGYNFESNGVVHRLSDQEYGFDESSADAFKDLNHAVYSTWDFDADGVSAGHNGVWIMAGLPHLQMEWSEAITNVAQLQMMALDLDASYTLANNIDASETSSWNAGSGFDPVGYSIGEGCNDLTDPFAGDFAGQGHTITALTINRGGENFVGLFGAASGSTITDVGLVGGSVIGENFVGALIGSNHSSTITSSYATGSVSGQNLVGGLIGDNESSAITSSYASGNVDGSFEVGGLVGYAYSSVITLSHATGSVSGRNVLGGLVGCSNSSSAITSSYASGNVSGSDIYVGGLVGWNTNSSTITSSYATGDVNGASDFGGLVGHNEANGITGITDSYSHKIYNALDLQLMQYDLDGNFTLMNNIDASDTVNWNAGAGFSPIGYGHEWLTPQAYFSGTFNGNDKTITGLYIDRPSLQSVGLFGATQNATLSNIKLRGVDITGQEYVGALAGWAQGTTVTDSSSTGEVSGSGSGIGGLAGRIEATSIYDSYSEADVVTSASGTGSIGGLVGIAGHMGQDTIERCYATGDVTGSNANSVGGLLGHANTATVRDSYATGNVSGTLDIGGLIGSTNGANIYNSYATGIISGGTSVGGLVGSLGTQYGASGIYNSYSTGAVTGSSSVGGLLGTQNSGTITDSGWWTGSAAQAIGNGSGTVTYNRASKEDFYLSSLGVYSSWDVTTVWRIYEGYAAPLLKSFLTALTVTANASSEIYNGTTTFTGNGVTYSAEPSSELKGTVSFTGSSKNVGSYAGGLTPTGLWSTQQGYDITCVAGDLTITQKAVTLSGITASDKVYDATTNAIVSTSAATFTGMIDGDDLTVSSTGVFSDKNVAVGKTVTLANTLGGTDLGNYNITTQWTTTADITKATVTLSGITASNKVYDSTTGATVSIAGATFAGKYAGDELTVSSTGVFSDKNVAAGKTVVLTNTLDGAALGNYTVIDQGTTTADITKAAVTLSGITVSDKIYDATTVATVSIADATFAGKYAGDDLTVSSTGVFSDKNVAAGKTVTLTNTLAGADLGNYAITDQGATTADITAIVTGAISGIGSGVSLALSLNGGTPVTTTTTDANGSFSFGGDLFVSAGDKMLIYVNDGSYRANLVGTVSAPENVTDLTLTNGQMSVGSANAVNIAASYSNSVLASAYYNNSNVYYSVANNALAVSGTDLYIPQGVAFTPGGDVGVTGDLSVAGTFDAGGHAISEGGNWDFDHVSNLGAVRLTGADKTITSGGTHFSDLMVTGTYSFNDAMTVSGDLALTAGSLTQGADLNITGDYVQTGGTFTDATPLNHTFTVSGSFSVPFGTAGFRRYTGTGATADPFIIRNIYDLQAMKSNLTSHFKLNSSLNASAAASWNSNTGFDPIGDSDHSFTGSLDGNGKVISNLEVDRAASNYLGFFGNIGSTGSVSNLGLEEISIYGHDYVGGLAGANAGSLWNVYTTGNHTVSGVTMVGGLVGNNTGSIANAYSSSHVIGTDQLGGLVGANTGSGTIHNTYAMGYVTGTSNAGGLVGANTSNAASSVSNSFWDKKMTGQETSSGGTAGKAVLMVADANGFATEDPETVSDSTALNMMSQNTYSGWDFTNTWVIDNGGTYPHFQFRYPEGVRGVGGHVYLITSIDGVSTESLAGAGQTVSLYYSADGITETSLNYSTATGASSRYYGVLDKSLVGDADFMIGKSLNGSSKMEAKSGSVYPLDIWGSESHTLVRPNMPTSIVVIPLTEPNAEVDRTLVDAGYIPIIVSSVGTALPSVTIVDQTGTGNTDQNLNTNLQNVVGGVPSTPVTDPLVLPSQPATATPASGTQSPVTNPTTPEPTDNNLELDTEDTLDEVDVTFDEESSPGREPVPVANDGGVSSGSAETKSSDSKGSVQEGSATKESETSEEKDAATPSKDDAKNAQWRDVSIENFLSSNEDPMKFLTDVRVIEGAVYVIDGANAMSLLGMGDSMRVFYKKHLKKQMKAPKKVVVQEMKQPSGEILKKEGSESKPVVQEPVAANVKQALEEVLKKTEAAEPEVMPAPEARTLKSISPIVMQQTKSGDRFGTLKSPGKNVFVRSNGKDWVPARDGMVILPGDEVKTAEKNSVEVLMDGGKVGRVEIKEGSLFRIQKAETDRVTGDRTTILDLALGRILVKVESLKGNSKFEVRTPTALTGVRGTVFEVTVKEKA